MSDRPPIAWAFGLGQRVRWTIVAPPEDALLFVVLWRRAIETRDATLIDYGLCVAADLEQPSRQVWPAQEADLTPVEEEG